MSSIDASALAQTWIHSHEEDHGDQMVYRPRKFVFRPSRGRRGFELRSDGTMAEFGPGPTDQTAERSGSWEMQEDGRLALYTVGSDTPSRVMKIASLSADKLVLQKT